MPPVSSPGSRTALITWSVVFAILFVTASVFSIYFYTDSAKARESEDKLRKQYTELAEPGELTGEMATQLRDAKSNPADGSQVTQGMSLLRTAVTQRDELAQKIGGPAVKSPADAQAKAQAAMANAVKAAAGAKITISATDSLSNALTTLANGVTARVQEVAALQQKLKEAQDQVTAEAAKFEQSRQEMAKQLEAVRAEQQKAIGDTATYQQTKDQSVAQIQQTVDQERSKAQNDLNAANVKIAELDRQLGQAKQQITTLQGRLGENRVNTQDPIVRKADGKIIRLPAKDVVYIDLGAAQSVTPGLTFEVYDKVDGIPQAGDPTTENALPKGKASIEVVRVGATSSECRVTRQTPGQQMSEGDLVANLIFDPNVKYNFVIYGEFDLDRNGVATPQDTEVIKRLVTQWGGALMDQVNVDTDFVVLGKEPVVPNFTREELQDPFNAKKQADSQAAADAYAKVRETAKELHIPILNQNRFLYLIGYYDQARR